MNISVCIGTYGHSRWSHLARSRAWPSAMHQADDVVLCHQAEGNVASCRNAAAEEAKGDFLIFLDADDELSPGYVDAMFMALASMEADPGFCMFTPRVSYVVRKKAQAPKFWPEKPLHEGNWMVIGTMVPKQLFLEVGGFEPWPHAYEDWHLFAKLWKAGADPVRVPDAIYRAHWMPDSRNRSMTREEYVRVHYELGRDLFPEHYPESWLAQHLGNIPRTARARRR